MRTIVLRQVLLTIAAGFGLVLVIGGFIEGMAAFAGTLINVMFYFNDHAFIYLKPTPVLDVVVAWVIAFVSLYLGGAIFISAARRMAGLTRRIGVALGFGALSIYFLLSTNLEGISDEGRWICIAMSFIMGTIAVFWPNPQRHRQNGNFMP